MPIHGKPRTTDFRPWLSGAALTGRSEHSSREIAARGAFEVMTEEIISRGSPPRLHTGRSVVRGKPGIEPNVDLSLSLCHDTGLPKKPLSDSSSD